MPLIDALKAIASQLIVLHHLSAYGPLSEAMQVVAPRLMDALFDYGRMAVQIFLVVAGFLVVRGFSPADRQVRLNPLTLLWGRYQRLVLPFMVAIGLTMVASTLASHWMDDEMIPDRASFGQWLAHLTLLHGVLGVDSLSAGVWYVAIDFQLFALMVLLLWLGRGSLLGPLLVLLVGALSLFVFNRNAGLDNWAPYFFGAYALGAVAWWASGRSRMALWLGVIATVGIAALVLDFRLRIAVALITALVLGFSRRHGLLERWPDWAWLGFLGRISYSVFLVHFSVCLLVNTLLDQMDGIRPATALLAFVLTWAGSLLAGYFFHRWVEGPAASKRISAVLGRVASGVIRLPLISALLARRT